MSIQQSINSALSTIGIVSGLYQNTPGYQEEQRVKGLKNRLAELESWNKDISKNATYSFLDQTNLTPEQRADPKAMEKYLAEWQSYNDQRYNLQKERADIYSKLGDFRTSSSVLAKAAGFYAGDIENQANYRAQIAQRAEAARQDRTERRDVVNQYIATLEQRANDPAYEIVTPDSATGVYLKGGNK